MSITNNIISANFKPYRANKPTGYNHSNKTFTAFNGSDTFCSSNSTNSKNKKKSTFLTFTSFYAKITKPKIKGLEEVNNVYFRTQMFRDPKLFPLLVDHIKTNYSQGADIIIGGCSVGLEPFSLAIKLIDELGDDAQKYKLLASDITPTAIELARLGYISSSNRDKDLSNAKKAGIENIFEYIKPCLDTDEKEQKLAKYNDVMKRGGFEPEKENERRVLSNVYDIDARVKEMVQFEVADLRDQLAAHKPDKPCVVLFRNVLHHFNGNKKELTEFAKYIYDNIPEGSTLVLGRYDLKFKIDNLLTSEEIGFKRFSDSSNLSSSFILVK